MWTQLTCPWSKLDAVSHSPSALRLLPGKQRLSVCPWGLALSRTSTSLNWHWAALQTWIFPILRMQYEWSGGCWEGSWNVWTFIWCFVLQWAQIYSVFPLVPSIAVYSQLSPYKIVYDSLHELKNCSCLSFCLLPSHTVLFKPIEDQKIEPNVTRGYSPGVKWGAACLSFSSYLQCCLSSWVPGLKKSVLAVQWFFSLLLCAGLGGCSRKVRI